MARERVRSELAEAEDAIKHCRRHIERARAEMAERRPEGYGFRLAQERLRFFQQALAEHEANRDRIKDEPDSL
jgi:hypothetical protein